METELNEAPAPDTEGDRPETSALRTYADKLLGLLPDGWTRTFIRDTPQVWLVPPSETEGWFLIYPENGSFAIRDRVFWQTTFSMRAKHPHRGVARRIAEEWYPTLATKVAQRRAENDRIQAHNDAMRAICAELASVCQRTKATIRDGFGIDLYVEDGPEWFLTARPEDGGRVRLNLPAMSIAHAQAILRMFDL